MITHGLLVETFTPQTLAETSDSQGGVTSAWTDGTAFRGRLSSLSADERMNADKTTVFASHRLYCNLISITEKDRIKLDTRTFEIKGIRQPSNLATGHLEIDLLEVD